MVAGAGGVGLALIGGKTGVVSSLTCFRLFGRTVSCRLSYLSTLVTVRVVFGLAVAGVS